MRPLGGSIVRDVGFLLFGVFVLSCSVIFFNMANRQSVFILNSSLTEGLVFGGSDPLGHLDVMSSTCELKLNSRTRFQIEIPSLARSCFPL